jgi:hypothetical protein
VKILIAFLLTLSASAGYLTINGQSDIEHSFSDEKLTFSGTYTISNKGDETAYDVFPTFHIAGWRWALDPQEIRQSQSRSYPMSAEIEAEKLKCIEYSNCQDNLPVIGKHPMLVKRHYRDGNGYAFTAANIQPVEFGELNPDQKYSLRVPGILMKVEIRNSGADGSGIIEIESRLKENKKIFLQLASAEEVKLKPASLTIELPSNSKKSVEFEIQNDTGLVGSSYAVFAIAQWQENGVRNSSFSSDLHFIRKASMFKSYVIGSVLLAALLLAVFWYVKMR